MGQYVSRHLMKNEKILFQTTVHWIMYFRVAAFLTAFVPQFFEQKTTEFVITNKRIVIKRGLNTASLAEYNLTAVKSIFIKHSYLGKIFGYGKVEICTVEGISETISCLAKARQFRSAFENAAKSHKYF